MRPEPFLVPFRRGLTAPRIEEYVNNLAERNKWFKIHGRTQIRDRIVDRESLYSTPLGLDYLIHTEVFSNTPSLMWDSTSIVLLQPDSLNHLQQFQRLDGSFYADVPSEFRRAFLNWESVRVVCIPKVASQVRMESYGDHVGLINMFYSYATNNTSKVHDHAA
ncbi:MAG: hypothetical protein ACE5FT_05485 [Candidatus Nanoarchaeia archaeon]